jgi:putative transcriptional regulator
LGEQENLSKFVKEVRGKLALTQEKFAEKIGVTFATINRWENGKTTPSPLGLKQVQNILVDFGPEGAELLKRYFGEGK